MNSKNDYFNKALHDFVSDVASGDAIRHLADKGMTVSEIAENLTFPLPKEKISEAVWKHYIASGVIRLDEAKNIPATEVTYVRDYDKYGKSSFRRVEKIIENSKDKEYVACDFGKELYNNRNEFLAKLDGLDKRDRDYILELPWPIETVWHIMDERMERISKILNEGRYT